MSATLVATDLSHLTNIQELCEQYSNFTTSDKRYTISQNVWGDDESGFQCMLVGENKDIESNATAFATTWAWGNGLSGVHGYPNVKLNSPALPLPLSKLKSLDIDISWSYSTGQHSNIDTDLGSKVLADTGINANAAVDLFFDAGPENATAIGSQKYEMMLWVGYLGEIEPVGYWSGVEAELELDSTRFRLFTGTNHVGQRVFTWIGPNNVTQFTADISPLIRRTAFYGGPNVTDYLGIVQFGTETFHTDNNSNVTFTAERVAMNVVEGVAKIDSEGAAVRFTLLWLSIAYGFIVYLLLGSWS